MARTNSTLVEDALQGDYIAGRSLTRPINVATLIVDQVVRCTTRKGITYSDELLLELETQLAAHYYTRTDRVYRSRATDRASGSFVLHPKNPEPYLATAKELDYSGCLDSAMSGRGRATVEWLGKDDPDKLTYDERN